MIGLARVGTARRSSAGPLVIVDLTYPYAFGHQPSLRDQDKRARRPVGQKVTSYGTRLRKQSLWHQGTYSSLRPGNGLAQSAGLDEASLAVRCRAVGVFLEDHGRQRAVGRAALQADSVLC